MTLEVHVLITVLFHQWSNYTSKSQIFGQMGTHKHSNILLCTDCQLLASMTVSVAYFRCQNLDVISHIISSLSHSSTAARHFLFQLQPCTVSLPPCSLHWDGTCQHSGIHLHFGWTERSLPTILVSLDLSTAFDTIDHCTLLNRLENSFGVTGLALSWIRSYLSNRGQCIAMEWAHLVLTLFL